MNNDLIFIAHVCTPYDEAKKSDFVFRVFSKPIEMKDVLIAKKDHFTIKEGTFCIVIDEVETFDNGTWFKLLCPEGKIGWIQKNCCRKVT